MTLNEFRMHRANLAVSLEGMAEAVGAVTQVDPVYEHGLRFEAVVEWDDGNSFDVLLCVGPEHPLFSEADDFPGCAGTWWWWDDLVAGGYQVP